MSVTGFTRTVTAVYSCTMLAVYLRVQLNILGGYMYQDTLNGCNGMVNLCSQPAILRADLLLFCYVVVQQRHQVQKRTHEHIKN